MTSRVPHAGHQLGGSGFTDGERVNPRSSSGRGARARRRPSPVALGPGPCCPLPRPRALVPPPRLAGDGRAHAQEEGGPGASSRLLRLCTAASKALRDRDGVSVAPGPWPAGRDGSHRHLQHARSARAGGWQVREAGPRAATPAVTRCPACLGCKSGILFRAETN